MKNWIATALRRDIVTRSLKVALVVGTILVVINYADKIIHREMAGGDLLKIMLTYCVPYGVATFASVSAVLHK